MTFLDRRLLDILNEFESKYTCYLPPCVILAVPEIKLEDETILSDVVFSKERKFFMVRATLDGKVREYGDPYSFESAVTHFVKYLRQLKEPRKAINKLQSILLDGDNFL